MASFSPRDQQRGRGGKRRSGVALFKSVSLFFSRSAAASRNRGGVREGGAGMRPELATGATRGGQPTAPSNTFLKKPTHFTREETDALTLIYDKLIGAGKSGSGSHQPSVSTAPLLQIKAKEGLERSVFRDLLHNTFNICAEDILMERIFCVFDNSSDGLVKLEEWLQGMSVFLRGTLEERIVFAFNVYDLNADGYIVREEIFTLLRNSLVKQPQDEDPEEGVKELVELVLKKLDRDKDGKLSLRDFRESVLEEPLFLEAFGQCLPSESAIVAFLATLS
ncbi:EFh [Nesidiocoris tenuis]|uniref:EFh n=1 Tax=Nesidiocoris tenuis TaxID=355587 RepID=A0ABN7AJ33_9HEMI|nr:EFh [Nesidiocoris tenuis]